MNKIVFNYNSGGLTNKGRSERLSLLDGHIKYQIGWFGYCTDRDHQAYRYETKIRTTKEKFLSLYSEIYNHIDLYKYIQVLDGDTLEIRMDVEDREPISVILPFDGSSELNKLLFLFFSTVLPRDLSVPLFIRSKK